MPTLQTLARIEALVWVLIYGGLVTLVVGMACLSRAPDLATWLMVIGSVVAAIGVLLIWVRSRLRADE
jgi:O-antigen/teichoic acid export membrane protein